MKLTKAKLQKLIQEGLEDLGGAGGPGMGSGDPGFSARSDLASAESRASSRESSRDILLGGMREIEELAKERGYDDIIDIIYRTSPDHETDEDDEDWSPLEAAYAKVRQRSGRR